MTCDHDHDDDDDDDDDDVDEDDIHNDIDEHTKTWRKMTMTVK